MGRGRVALAGTIRCLRHFRRNSLVRRAAGFYPHRRTLAALVGEFRRIFAAGLGIAAAVGLPLGVGIGVWSCFERDHDRSSSNSLRMILAAFVDATRCDDFRGLGDFPVIFLIAVAAVWLRCCSTPPPGSQRSIRNACCSLAASRHGHGKPVYARLLCHRFLVTSSPVYGLAVGIAWIVLVPAEMLGVRAGLGYYIFGYARPPCLFWNWSRSFS